MRRLRWLTVVLPVAVIIAIEALTDHYLDEILPSPFDVMIVPAFVLALAILFARAAFGHMDRLSRDIARLQEEVREVAVLTERERIAREMHDGLAQVLGYVNTKALAVEEMLAAGETTAAREQLAELSAAARSVYVDVREAILGLTSPIATDRGLLDALEAYALRFSDASKLATHVAATADAQEIELAPEIETQVFRIVQEALTNVRKHAAGRRAEIALDVHADALVVAVADDGRGFDPDALPSDGWPRFGMQAIRERASSIGAKVSWTGRPGGGTVFRLAIPLERARAEAVG